MPLYYALVSAAHLLIYFGAGDSGDSETGSIGEGTAEFSDSKSEEDGLGDAKGKLIKNVVLGTCSQWCLSVSGGDL